MVLQGHLNWCNGRPLQVVTILVRLSVCSVYCSSVCFVFGEVLFQEELCVSVNTE